MLLEGKKALVTGSSRGIGKAIVIKFLSEGASVWGICTKPSQSKDELEQIAKEHGVSFVELYANASDSENWSNAIKGALEAAGGFDILVNNAGITRDNLVMKMTEDDFDRVLDTNLKSCFNTINIFKTCENHAFLYRNKVTIKFTTVKIV